MIEFAWPWMALSLPLPWLARRVLPPLESARQAAMKVPFLDDFAVLQNVLERSAAKWQLYLAALGWCLLVLAAARPQWVGEPIEQAISGRDLMLAVDLSASMEEQDFVVNGQAIDRLTATKQVLRDFIARRSGDRLGLILFGTQAYLQTPLTFDRQTVANFLDEAVLGLAGENTAIGDAIGLAVKRLRKQQDNSKVLILLTDGANTAGEIAPIKAAELAAKEKLKIYTIGIGADEILVRSFFGMRKVNPSQDLDEKTLSAIAASTHGRYFRARDSAELNKIYQELDKLEPVQKDRQYFRPQAELYYWPLTLAFLLAVGLNFWRVSR